MGPFEMIFILALLIFGLPLLLIYALVCNRGRRAGQASADEQRVMTRLLEDLDRMQQRVDALETILRERRSAPPPL